MKRLVLFGFLFILFACTDQLSEVQLQNQEVQFDDLSKHNMELLPDKPNSNDEIRLVVFDDCTYNQLSGINRSGNMIDIQKQFNGMMKWPCFIENDTILIGKLPQGSYNVNYTLIDISQTAPQNISVSFNFQLVVVR